MKYEKKGPVCSYFHAYSPLSRLLAQTHYLPLNKQTLTTTSSVLLAGGFLLVDYSRRLVISIWAQLLNLATPQGKWKTVYTSLPTCREIGVSETTRWVYIHKDVNEVKGKRKRTLISEFLIRCCASQYLAEVNENCRISKLLIFYTS